MGIVSNYVNEVRHEFLSQELSKKSVDPNPVKQLEKWIEEAVDSQVLEPNAMIVSTVDDKLQIPSSRVVYLRGIENNNLRFYTNYHSRKGAEIEEATSSNISVLFFYAELERQVRVEGTISRLSEEESDAYFNSRPIESKLGAWASEQSQEIESRQVLIDRLEMYKQKFGDEVPRPPHWGGYEIKPGNFEFWQGRPARLHDRIVYTKVEPDNSWEIKRIAP
ncbi:MAG: pyridoxamine 5'-phosphate oxidase [Crocinitomicaceae bacterium]|nr:pyridoxamine 5'-phosphate oxidase [Crocinitomicaceae bacterium]|tara:strand:+ start:435 stop:1097 length:663 start_codon:yes stop_codon:yes gene_type:complete